jgi:hypothetical protein
MKNLLSIILILLLISCVSKKETSFTEIECVKEEMPKFDGRKVSLLDENGVAFKDTIIEKIEKRRTVFKPCIDYIYRANFYDEKKNLITSTRIKMTATGKRWEFQPEIQDEVIIQYEYSKKDEERAAKYKLNKKLPNYGWMKETKTGIIENVEKIWMHPFRSNQFSFTEVAPFPEIKYPIEIGKSWTGQLRIQEGWGDWENTSGNFNYEITSKEPIEIKYGKIDKCWKVKSKSNYPFGKSNFDYWFSENLGFVKMNYRNYGGQYLEIELEEMNER